VSGESERGLTAWQWTAHNEMVVAMNQNADHAISSFHNRMDHPLGMSLPAISFSKLS
jgi:hypothetical protein